MRSLSNLLCGLLTMLLLMTYTSTVSAFGVSEASQIVIDPGGNAVAIWETDMGTHFEVRSSTYNAGLATWSAAVTVSTVGQHSFASIITMNSSGNVVALWVFDDLINHMIWLQSAQLPSLGAWTAPVNVSLATETVRDIKVGIGNPNYNLKMNDLGDIAATWTSRIILTGDFVVRTATATFGGAWTTPITLSP